MAKIKKTFGDLKERCFFWMATWRGITRAKVFYTNAKTEYTATGLIDTGKVSIGTSWYNIHEVEATATEFHTPKGDNWYANKEDARKAHYEMMKQHRPVIVAELEQKRQELERLDRRIREWEKNH